MSNTTYTQVVLTPSSPGWNAPAAAPRPGAAQWRTGYELAGSRMLPGTARVRSARHYLPAHQRPEADDARERRDARGPCLDGHHSRLLVLAGYAERYGGLDDPVDQQRTLAAYRDERHRHLGQWPAQPASGEQFARQLLSVHLHDDGHFPLPLLDPSAIPVSELSRHHHRHPVTPRAARSS